MRGERQFKSLDEGTWDQLEYSRSTAQSDHERTVLERELRGLLREAVMSLTPEIKALKDQCPLFPNLCYS